MPWGPHKDKDINDLPLPYIKRLLERMNIRDLELKAALEKRLETNEPE